MDADNGETWEKVLSQQAMKDKKAKEIEDKKRAQRNNARSQELEGLETSEFSIRVEIPTPTAKRCTMVAKTMQMLFKTMSQSTKAQIMEIKGREYNLQHYEDIPFNEEEMKLHFKWRSNKTSGQKMAVMIEFTIVTEVAKSQLLNAQVMALAKRNRFWIFHNTFVTMDIQEVGFIRGMSMTHAFRANIQATLKHELKTTGELPYYEVVKRTIYVNDRPDKDLPATRLSAEVPMIRCEQRYASDIIKMLVEATTDVSGPYAFVPMMLVHSDKRMFMNQIRTHNKQMHNMATTTVYGMHPQALEWTGRFFGKETTLRQAIYTQISTVQTDASAMEDKENRVISSVEKTHQTKTTGKHFFTYQDELKEKAEEVIEKVCEEYNKHVATMDIPEPFQTMSLKFRPVLKTDYKTRIQTDTTDLPEFNKFHQKRRQAARLCFAAKPPTIKKHKSYRDSLGTKPTAATTATNQNTVTTTPTSKAAPTTATPATVTTTALPPPPPQEEESSAMFKLMLNIQKEQKEMNARHEQSIQLFESKLLQYENVIRQQQQHINQLLQALTHQNLPKQATAAPKVTTEGGDTEMTTVPQKTKALDDHPGTQQAKKLKQQQLPTTTPPKEVRS